MVTGQSNAAMQLSQTQAYKTMQICGRKKCIELVSFLYFKVITTSYIAMNCGDRPEQCSHAIKSNTGI